jgi:hypothetical protein
VNEIDRAWADFEALRFSRSGKPVDAAKEYLRRLGWVVERPETLTLPVKVARTGSFTEQDGYRVTLHTRVVIGDRLVQCDTAIDMHHAETLPHRAFTGAVANKFSRMIVEEIEGAIDSGFKREIERARKESE